MENYNIYFSDIILAINFYNNFLKKKGGGIKINKEMEMVLNFFLCHFE